MTSLLCTPPPHLEILEKLEDIFCIVFDREGSKFINVNNSKAYFSNTKHNSFKSFTKQDLVRILFFILDNIFVTFGDKTYKQVIGIPIGLDSGQDIANLLLFYYESTHVENVAKDNFALARKFSECSRYIDDLFSSNFSEFHNHIPLIYPQALEVNKSSDLVNKVNYLDLNINIDDSNDLILSIYDKRDDFPFDIVNFPFLDSCIPRKPALGIYLSQLIRYARICSKYEDFCSRSRRLIFKLKSQGYKTKELKKLTVRFYKERQDSILKYNINDINVLVSHLDL